MKIDIVEGAADAASAEGHVVVIDVLRAFTTAAFAFAQGAENITLVSTAAEAYRIPAWRMGEIDGRLIPKFDHDNSPSKLAGKRVPPDVVQRTGSGTQCAVLAARNATSLWLGSLVVVSATARALKGLDPVCLVASGCPDEGEEDFACADVLRALLLGETPDFDRAIRQVRESRAAKRHAPRDPDRPIEDVACAVDVDRFDFAMGASMSDGRLVARRVFAGSK